MTPAMRCRDTHAAEAARRSGYVVTRSVHDRAHLDHREWCRRNRLPYVSVREHRSYATVRLDMDPCAPGGGWSFAPAAIEQARAWFAGAPGLKRDAWLVAGGSGCTIYGVPLRASAGIARRLYELALSSRPGRGEQPG